MGGRYIFANLSGLKAYSDMIPEWNIFCRNEGNYILIPDSANQTEIVEEIMDNGNLLGLDKDNLKGVFTYKDGLSVIEEED